MGSPRIGWTRLACSSAQEQRARPLLSEDAVHGMGRTLCEAPQFHLGGGPPHPCVDGRPLGNGQRVALPHFTTEGNCGEWRSRAMRRWPGSASGPAAESRVGEGPPRRLSPMRCSPFVARSRRDRDFVMTIKATPWSRKTSGDAGEGAGDLPAAHIRSSGASGWPAGRTRMRAGSPASRCDTPQLQATRVHRVLPRLPGSAGGGARSRAFRAVPRTDGSCDSKRCHGVRAKAPGGRE